jgi:molecular chaperone GrpE
MAISGKATDAVIERQPKDAIQAAAGGTADATEDASGDRPASQEPVFGAPGGTPGSVPLEEFERLKAERDQLLDRLARLQAEFENARKREARERADFRDFAVASAVEQFLPVLDHFQLALASSGSAEQLRTGVGLIVKQMEDVLRSLNVQPVEGAGAKFDPRVHEALETVERDDLPDNQVLDEVRRGYRIRERLLRPALVRVVSNPQQKEA